MSTDTIISVEVSGADLLFLMLVIVTCVVWVSHAVAVFRLVILSLVIFNFRKRLN